MRRRRLFGTITLGFSVVVALSSFIAPHAAAVEVGTSVLVTVIPAAPTNLAASPISQSRIDLTWTDNSLNEVGFSVERKTNIAGTYAEVATTTQSIASYSDTALNSDTTYFYRVRAFNNDGFSDYSNEASATTQSEPPPSGGGGGGGGVLFLPTTVIFTGRAYPGTAVTLLKDAQIAAATVAGGDSLFQILLSGIASGSYVFSLYGEDSSGRRSPLQSFPISITQGATTEVSGIFLAPTIAVDKSEVRRGDNIAIFGQTANNSDVTIIINSDQEIILKTPSDDDGIYLFNFDTSPLKLEQHLTKSRAVYHNEVSPFSRSVNFVVGTQNVAAKPLGECPLRADLNGDCRVNLVDFSIAAFWYQRPLSVEFAQQEAAHLNGNGVVNLIDFSIMAFYWTG